MGGMGRRAVLALIAAVVIVAAGVGTWALATRPHGQPEPVRRVLTFADVLPAPAEAVAAPGVTFTIPPGATIVTSPDDPEAARVATYLAGLIGAATPRPGSGPVEGGIALLHDAAVTGDEAYELEVDAHAVTIRAGSGAGLFRGVQTLRQLMPASGPLVIPGGRIDDRPRYAYRGAMLDVARHFFDVAAVERFIDLAAMYKVNYLHLHLSDDQGWRIAVDGWPRLTEYGATTQVGGGAGGFYTQDDYRAIIAYAATRYMTVVPEIDLPGHTNAALASYAQLSCDGTAPPLFTGIAVGFSALCPDDATYSFLDDVLGELAALTPGPYLHIGGDEASTLTAGDYARIVDRAQQIVTAHGKAAVGWHDAAKADLASTTVLEYWSTNPYDERVVAAAASGTRVILAPANHAYLDQKYDQGTRIGLTWAGPTSVEESYDWDPATYLSRVDASAVLGVEAPLWTETVATVDDIEYLALPRLAAIAEVAWSPSTTHDWSTFRERLGAQAPRWDALGVDFARVVGVPWVT
jgi:hexosaminidase